MPENNHSVALKLNTRGGRPGFTTIEILIVVTILAIVALIAIPKAMETHDEAKESALITDIQTVRRQIELYKLEHGGQGPHLNQKGKNNTKNFVARLTGRTDADGKVNDAGACGPYLMEWPSNPFCSTDVAADVKFGTKSPQPRNGKSGWYYNTDTCLFSANSEEGGESTDEKVEEDIGSLRRSR